MVLAVKLDFNTDLIGLKDENPNIARDEDFHLQDSGKKCRCLQQPARRQW